MLKVQDQVATIAKERLYANHRSELNLWPSDDLPSGSGDEIW